MNIPTPDSLRATRRRLARRVGRLEKAELVLAELRAGAALHLQHTKGGRSWALSNGRQVSNTIAKLVIASASVTDVGDALFDGCAAQTFRWWRDEGGDPKMTERRKPRPKPEPETIEFEVEATAQDIAQAHEDGITGAEMLERAVERALCQLERKLKLN